MTIIDWNRHGRGWRHFRETEFPKSSKRRSVDLLIGCDYPEHSIALEERIGNPGEPIARRTSLGWTCVGRISSSSPSVSTQVTHICCRSACSSLAELNEQLRASWSLDSIGIIRKEGDESTPGEKIAVEKAESSRRFLGDR